MAPPAAADRSKLLQELDLRHDTLLRELDELNLRVEQALGALRPPSPGSVSIGVSRRDALAQSSEED